MGVRIVPPPPALGCVDASPEKLEMLGAAARHVLAVVRHRTLSPAQQVQALLLVAANIAAAVPDHELGAACDFFCTDAALRWHHATADRFGLASMMPVGSA